MKERRLHRVTRRRHGVYGRRELTPTLFPHAGSSTWEEREKENFGTLLRSFSDWAVFVFGDEVVARKIGADNDSERIIKKIR